MIPIYRARKIDSDEYVTGFLNMAFDYGNYEEEDVEEPEKKYFLIQFMDNESSDTDMWSFNGFNEIDISTLAIDFHYTNVKDLFFGVDNGKGASIIEAVFIDDNTPFKGIAMHTHYGYVFYDKNDDWVHISKLFDIKVIGIQEWFSIN